MESAFTWISSYGYAAIFGLLMLGIVGLPVPDEALLTFVGYLSFRGELMLAPSLASAFLGSACGISLSYTLGRLVGPALLTKLSGTFLVNPEHIAQAQQWVQRWGKYTLLIAYFVPGVRHLAALLTGMSTLPPGAFMRFAYTGALLWSGTFIMIGYWLGEEWTRLSPTLHRSLLLVGLVVGLLLLAGLMLARRWSRTHEPSP
jgi:membrane protein DedA with SNARE-associated domain